MNPRISEACRLAFGLLAAALSLAVIYSPYLWKAGLGR